MNYYPHSTITLLQKGKINTRDVFDLGEFSKYFAICDILQTYHGTIPKSLRFYFNPVSKLFEPIGFDGHFLDKK